MKPLSEKIMNNLAAIPLALVPLVFTYRATHYYVPKAALLQALGFGIFCAWIVYLALKKPGARAGVFRTDAPALLFLAWTGLSAAWAANRYLSLEAFVFSSALAAVYLYVSRAEPSLKVLSAAVSGAASAASAYGIMQFLGRDFLKPAPLQHVSTFGNVNFAGEFVAAALFLTAGLFFSGAPKEKIPAGCAGALQLSYLAITGARGAWAGFAAGLTVFLILISKTGLRTGRLLLPALSVLTAAVIMISALGGREALGSFADRAFSIFNPRHPTARVRFYVWRSALQIIGENPVAGSGAGNLQIIYPLFRHPGEIRISGTATQVARAHNDFIETAVDSGLIGLGLFLWLIGEGARSVKKGINSKSRLEAGLAAGLSCLLVSALFGFPLRAPSTALFFWAGLGAVSRHGGTGRKFPVFPGNPLFAAGGAFVVFLLVSAHSGIRLLADTHLKTAMEHETMGEWTPAKNELETSLKYYYPDIHAHNRLAGAYIRLGDIENAYAQLNALLELHPNHPWANRALGQIYFELGRREKGLELLEKAAALNPVFISYFGKALFLEGRTAEAERAIKEQIRGGFGDGHSYACLGEIYEARGETERALKAYGKALEEEPGLRFPAERIERMENPKKGGEANEHNGDNRSSG